MQMFKREFISRSDYSLWIDQDILGGTVWEKEISNAIKELFAFIFIVTPNSRMSEYVFREVIEAVKMDIIIIPLIYSTPRDGLSKGFAIVNEYQALDFSDLERQRWDDLLVTLEKHHSFPSTPDATLQPEVAQFLKDKQEMIFRLLRQQSEILEIKEKATTYWTELQMGIDFLKERGREISQVVNHLQHSEAPSCYMCSQVISEVKRDEILAKFSHSQSNLVDKFIKAKSELAEIDRMLLNIDKIMTDFEDDLEQISNTSVK